MMASLETSHEDRSPVKTDDPLNTGEDGRKDEMKKGRNEERTT
jgi:hypothetical protein